MKRCNLKATISRLHTEKSAQALFIKKWSLMPLIQDRKNIILMLNSVKFH